MITYESLESDAVNALMVSIVATMSHDITHCTKVTLVVRALHALYGSDALMIGINNADVLNG